VALTRARNALIIIGRRETLTQKSQMWRALWNHGEDNGCVFTAAVALQEQGVGRALRFLAQAATGSAPAHNFVADHVRQLFVHTPWQLPTFMAPFAASFARMKTSGTREAVWLLLYRLATGEHPTVEVSTFQRDFPLLRASRLPGASATRTLRLLWFIDICPRRRRHRISVFDIVDTGAVEKSLVPLKATFASWFKEWLALCAPIFSSKRCLPRQFSDVEFAETPKTSKLSVLPKSEHMQDDGDDASAAKWLNSDSPSNMFAIAAAKP
jgi:hypothetical protein